MTRMFKVHLLLAAVSLLPAHALAVERLEPVAGVHIECHPGPCLDAAQFITARQAWQMKRSLGDDMLLVDIRGRAEAFFARMPSGADAQVAFMEPVPQLAWNVAAQEPELEIRLDFVHKLDEVMRALRIPYDRPVVLMSPAPGQAVVAALLLQENGFSRVYVVREGFDGRMAQR